MPSMRTSVEKSLLLGHFFSNFRFFDLHTVGEFDGFYAKCLEKV